MKILKKRAFLSVISLQRIVSDKKQFYIPLLLNNHLGPSEENTITITNSAGLQ